MVYLHTVGRVLDSGGSLGWSSDDVPELDSQELGHLLAVCLDGCDGSDEHKRGHCANDCAMRRAYERHVTPPRPAPPRALASPRRGR